MELSQDTECTVTWKLLVDTFPSIDAGKATGKNAMLLSKGKEN